MGLHKDYEDKTFSDYSYDEDVSDLDHKKKIKRLLEEKLERKRLKDEFKDDFDELNGEFDWDDLVMARSKSTSPLIRPSASL